MNITQSLIKYYINFLETDFRKERSPKRKFKGKESFLDIGKKFGDIAQLIFSELSKNHEDEEEITLKITKGKHFFKSDISKTAEILKSIEEFFDSKGNLIQGYLIKQELDKKNKLNQEMIDIISGFSHKSEFIDFFKDTDYLEVIKNIENTHFSDSGNILLGNITYYKLDEEGNKEYIDQENENHALANYLFKKLSDIITENDRQILSSFLTYKEFKDFLENIKNKDIFYILQDIDKDRKSNEKLEIFFNFFEIKIINNETKRIESFPLFFIECDLIYSNSCFIIKFNKTINFNRKFIRYLTQKIEGGIDWSLSPSEGIFTQSDSFINDVNLKILDLLNKIQIQKEVVLEKIYEFKKITSEKNIKTYQEFKQIPQNHTVEISNNCGFSVDEKEFVLIDPETLPNNDRIIINGFIEENIKKILSGNPKNYNSDIQYEVDSMGVEDKLSYISPIPLNEQQIQILKSLEKDGCNNIIVEGPPGTGKSHSIVAILQHCIKNKKKVLFVSDKKEALDVVEEKINNVFDSGSIKAPIIRIGGSNGENNFGKLLSPSYITSLKNHRQNSNVSSEEHLYDHKDGINKILQKEINLVYNKIINNFGNIQYYLENEEECEGFLKEFFVESDKDKESIVKFLSYIQVLGNLNNDYLSDFNIFEANKSGIKLEKNIFENLIGYIDNIEGIIEGSKNSIKLIVENFNQDMIFQEEKKYYKNIFAIELKKFIENYFYSEQLDTLQEIKDFCEELNFMRMSLDNIHIKNIKNISFKDIKNKEMITEINNLVEEYYKIYTNFLGITKIFQKEKLQTIAKSIKDICNNSNFDVINFETIKNIKQNDIIELNKIYKLHDIQQFNFKNYIKNINIIKENNIDLSLFENTEKYFDLSKFEIFGIEDINGYLLLENVFGIISQLKKIFGEIKNIDNINLGLVENNIKSIIKETIPLDETILLDYKYIETIGKVKNDCNKTIYSLEKLERFFEDYEINTIEKEFINFTSTLRKNEIQTNNIKTFNNQITYSIDFLERLEKFLNIKFEIGELIKFYEEYPSYFEKKRELEKKSATHLFGNLADRFINYYSNNRNDLQTIKKLFGGKIQITDESQSKLLEMLQEFLITVGVVIINIRDIFQYLPLQKDLFDVIIIDEASQVSIGQAFMLLPLAKKVIVLGDKKQFPNIIAMNSDKSIDDYYFQEILSLGKDDLEKSRLDTFRVRNSVLDYMQRICNFEITLKYHFRGYEDLISYSNKTFYNNNLISPKIRSKNIQDIIKFDFLEVDSEENLFGESTGSIEVSGNINKMEVDFIFNKLQEFKSNNFKGTIGILTPFRDQQRNIQSMIYNSDIKERFEKDCKGIIATFDSCQGQEKDYIFYSMVTNGGGSGKGCGNLNTIFPVKIGDLNDDEVKLKEARLNVGFSRSKDTVHFILSTKLEKIGGSIGDALRHFYAKTTNSIENNVDKNSEREKELIQWIKSTDFYINHYNDISIIPQFPIGEYLNQISNTQIPHYRVDFLCTMKKGDKQKIFIVEYDGFEYHFENKERVNENNFENYQIEKDIERQKIIEYYGYQFLRYNKFILANKPIEKINKDLYSLYDSF